MFKILKVILSLVLILTLSSLPTYADYLITEQDEDHFHTSGFVDEGSYFATVIPSNNFTYRRGRIGLKSFNVTSHKVRRITFIDGNVDGEPIDLYEYNCGGKICSYCGGRICRRGSIGDKYYRTTTKRVGNELITTGWYGNNFIDATTVKQEDGSIYTSGIISGIWFGD